MLSARKRAVCSEGLRAISLRYVRFATALFPISTLRKDCCATSSKVVGTRIFFKPRVVVCVPSGVTEVEKRSVIEATEEAGARHTYLIEEPIAAAIGAGIDISQPRGNMVVDIGGGTTDVAIISLGGSVLSESIKVAGDRFDESIVRYMRKSTTFLSVSAPQRR